MLADAGIVALGLHDVGIPESPDESVIEVFATFEENAMAKARYFAALTGRPCLADDSGLRVDALDGEPGVRSRRFATDRGGVLRVGDDEDAANNDALLDACWNSGWAPPWRAHFVCAAAFADPGRELVAVGIAPGAIVPERHGSDGFGYDPYFVSADLGVTFASVAPDAKARVSHRARAFAQLFAMLAADQSSLTAC